MSSKISLALIPSFALRFGIAEDLDRGRTARTARCFVDLFGLDDGAETTLFLITFLFLGSGFLDGGTFDVEALCFFLFIVVGVAFTEFLFEILRDGLAVAVREGSTMVRVGTALFGERGA